MNKIIPRRTKLLKGVLGKLNLIDWTLSTAWSLFAPFCLINRPWAFLSKNSAVSLSPSLPSGIQDRQKTTATDLFLSAVIFQNHCKPQFPLSLS